MKFVRLILIASIVSMLVASPIGLAQANDAHHPAGASATKQVQPKLKKKIPTKKNQVAKSKQSSQMSMGGKMNNCPMMQGGPPSRSGMMHESKMKCPKMSADSSSKPLHSLRMQWHHNMIIWHHNMMHGQSPMHRGS